VQLIKGDLQVNDVVLKAGDGLGISDEKVLNLKALSPAEFLVFDLR